MITRVSRSGSLALRRGLRSALAVALGVLAPVAWSSSLAAERGPQPAKASASSGDLASRPMSQGQTAVQPNDKAAFGLRLASAASSQRWWLTIYNPAYKKIPYPMGDVPSYQGVCTDVVVRAYRELGIDLQERVHKARVGTGDTNIDHRRVLVLARYFARHGQTLPITDKPEDYNPGDIVTYYLPDGQFSKTHIAIVAAEKNANGVPLVIHNRGYSVQLEDWLFAEKITGHYRYAGKR